MTLMSEPLVLIIEDDEPKLRAVKNYLQELIPEVALKHANSLTGAIQILSLNEVTIAIVDMSLPTYDAAKDHT